MYCLISHHRNDESSVIGIVVVGSRWWEIRRLDLIMRKKYERM